MSFTIKHGLFKANITDYHAILGVALDAEPKAIRLKYLRTAQKLHPDTCRGDSEEKKLAGKILSKLVNPAYEELSNKSKFAEHQLVLTQIGKSHAERSDRLTMASEPARKLLSAEKDLEKVYYQLLEELVKEQYQQIDKILINIAVISELNFIYLVLKQKQGINREEQAIKKQFSKPIKSHRQAPSQGGDRNEQKASKIVFQDNVEESTPQSRSASYIRRAKEYLEKGNINDVISELRDALKIDPNNATAHALMGKAYLKQNRLTMAKVHVNKANSVEPKNPEVIQSKELLEKVTKKQGRKSTKSQSKNADDKKSNDSGFFSGFFSAKKK